MRNRGLRLHLLLAAVLALAPAGAAAAPSWEPVRPRIQGIPSGVAQDGNRTLLVAPARRRIVLTTIDGGRAVARTIATGGTGTRRTPVVLASPRGSAAVVWQQSVGGASQIVASLRGARNSRWTTPRTISAYPAAGFGRVFATAQGPDGTFLVAWWGGPAGGRLGISARTWRLGAGWSPAIDVSGGTYAAPPPGSIFVGLGAAVGPRGDMAVTWQELTGVGGVVRRRVALQPAGQEWQPALTFGEGRIGGTYHPFPLAVDGSGRVLSAWLENPDGGPAGTPTETCLHTAVAAKQAVDEQVLRCVPFAAFGKTRAAADSAGNLTAGWQLGRFSPSLQAEIQLAALPTGATTWTVPTPLFADDKGFLELSSIRPTGVGHFSVAVTQGQAVLPRDEGFVQITTVDASDAPISPVLNAPELVGRVRQTDVSFLPFGQGAGGVLTWVTETGATPTSRLAILRP